MNVDQIKYENERYFPNHRLDPEIGLAEYNAAANRLSNEALLHDFAYRGFTM